MMRIFAGVWAAAALAFAGAAAAAPVNTGHLQAELVAGAASVAPGKTVYVALSQKIDKGWHTYWRNPGDSGEATQIAWTLPAGWKAGDIVWAPPHRLPVGPLLKTTAITGDVLLPVPITAPANAKPGQTVQLKADVAFLVCEDICVPENATLTLSLPVAAASAPADPRVAKALADAPKPANLTAAFEKRPAGVALAVTGAALKGADLGKAYFFPFDSTVIDHAKPQAIERGPEGLTLTLPAGYAFQKGTPPKVLAGVLSLGGRAYEVSARPGPAPKGAAGLGPPPGASGPKSGSADLGLPLAAAFAFLGGLILNLMPCVFPILAMKAASLAGHAHGGEGRRQGLAFGAGVIVTFLALAGAMIALQAAGASIGWGFQLQSPPVVAVLALLMLAVALNLSGVFEIGASLQGVGSGAAARGGLSGSFFTGMLAVVVAAPCTAPFMAPALGWSLTQSPVAALTVFAALGVGFALPFVAVAFAPGLLSRLPRPGPWMVTFRKVLAFPMYAAAAWLLWVLTVQAGEVALARLLAAAVVLALGVWLAGLAQGRASRGARPVLVAGFALVLVAVSAAAAVWPPYAEVASGGSGSATAETPYEAYSPERLAALRAEGRPVFVNYTAAWCVTCQVNDRLALSRSDVAEAFKRTNAVYLKADWTRKDAVIAADLASHGRAGVPLYLVYGKSGGDPVVLPQILNEGLVIKALEKAAT